MLKESRRFAVGSLLLCCLLTSQAYAAKPVAAEINSNPATSSQNTAGNPAQTAQKNQISASAEKQPETGSAISGSLANGGLQHLSIVESILSLLLTAVFLLVLIRGNLFKHPE